MDAAPEKSNAFPQAFTALWTARYCVTTSQRTRQLADHNPRRPTNPRLRISFVAQGPWILGIGLSCHAGCLNHRPAACVATSQARCPGTCRYAAPFLECGIGPRLRGRRGSSRYYGTTFFSADGGRLPSRPFFLAASALAGLFDIPPFRPRLRIHADVPKTPRANAGTYRSASSRGKCNPMPCPSMTISAMSAGVACSMP